jgi:hypothetical protein
MKVKIAINDFYICISFNISLQSRKIALLVSTDFKNQFTGSLLPSGLDDGSNGRVLSLEFNLQYHFTKWRNK